MACPETIIHTRGDTFQLSGVVLADNIAMNLTGASLKFTIRTGTDKTINPILVQVIPTIVSAVAGTYSISANVSSLEIGEYFCDIELTDSLGAITTIYKSSLTITYDIT